MTLMRRFQVPGSGISSGFPPASSLQGAQMGSLPAQTDRRYCSASKSIGNGCGSMLAGYSDSLQEDRRLLLSKYRFIDIVQKVVGVGSVGTRCYIALLLGNESSDPLFLQVKEAQASVLERHLGLSSYSSHARRVVS